MTLTALFAYGSLRPGQDLDWYMEDAEGYLPATINGRLYEYVSNGRLVGFPVADLEADGTITGDIWIINTNNLNLRACIRMETHAGYEPREVEAVLGDGNRTPTIAFHFPYKECYGPEVKEGDWLKHIEENGQSRHGFR